MLQKNMTEHNPVQPQIPDYPYRTLTTRGSESEKKIYYLIQEITNLIIKIHITQNINYSLNYRFKAL